MACAQAGSFTPPAFVESRETLSSQIAIASTFVDQLMHFIARFRNPDEREGVAGVHVRKASNARPRAARKLA
jgi:hypothetical protein